MTGELDRAGVVEPDLMGVPVGSSHDERPLERRGEALEMRPDADGLVQGYVPSSQLRRYVSCSDVSVSISTPIPRSLSRATSSSISVGTG